MSRRMFPFLVEKSGEIKNVYKKDAVPLVHSIFF